MKKLLIILTFLISISSALAINKTIDYTTINPPLNQDYIFEDYKFYDNGYYTMYTPYEVRPTWSGNNTTYEITATIKRNNNGNIYGFRAVGNIPRFTSCHYIINTSYANIIQWDGCNPTMTYYISSTSTIGDEIEELESTFYENGTINTTDYIIRRKHILSNWQQRTANQIRQALGGDTAYSGDPDISSCAQINSSGTYTLTSNLESAGTCLTFGNTGLGNVTIDCNGYNITFGSTVSSTAYYGIHIRTTSAGDNNSGVWLQNCNIMNYQMRNSNTSSIAGARHIIYNQANRVTSLKVINSTLTLGMVESDVAEYPIFNQPSNTARFNIIDNSNITNANNYSKNNKPLAYVFNTNSNIVNITNSRIYALSGYQSAPPGNVYINNSYYSCNPTSMFILDNGARGGQRAYTIGLTNGQRIENTIFNCSSNYTEYYNLSDLATVDLTTTAGTRYSLTGLTIIAGRNTSALSTGSSATGYADIASSTIITDDLLFACGTSGVVNYIQLRNTSVNKWNQWYGGCPNASGSYLVYYDTMRAKIMDNKTKNAWVYNAWANITDAPPYIVNSITQGYEDTPTVKEIALYFLNYTGSNYSTAFKNWSRMNMTTGKANYIPITAEMDFYEDAILYIQPNYTNLTTCQYIQSAKPYILTSNVTANITTNDCFRFTNNSLNYDSLIDCDGYTVFYNTTYVAQEISPTTNRYSLHNCRFIMTQNTTATMNAVGSSSSSSGQKYVFNTYIMTNSTNGNALSTSNALGFWVVNSTFESVTNTTGTSSAGISSTATRKLVRDSTIIGYRTGLSLTSGTGEVFNSNITSVTSGLSGRNAIILGGSGNITNTTMNFYSFTADGASQRSVIYSAGGNLNIIDSTITQLNPSANTIITANIANANIIINRTNLVHINSSINNSIWLHKQNSTTHTLIAENITYNTNEFCDMTGMQPNANKTCTIYNWIKTTSYNTTEANPIINATIEIYDILSELKGNKTSDSNGKADFLVMALYQNITTTQNYDAFYGKATYAGSTQENFTINPRKQTATVYFNFGAWTDPCIWSGTGDFIIKYSYGCTFNNETNMKGYGISFRGPECGTITINTTFRNYSYREFRPTTSGNCGSVVFTKTANWYRK